MKKPNIGNLDECDGMTGYTLGYYQAIDDVLEIIRKNDESQFKKLIKKIKKL